MAAIIKCDVLPASTITIDALSRYKYISMGLSPAFHSVTSRETEHALRGLGTRLAIHRPWRKLRGGICRYKTFCMRIFVRRTFLRFRYCNIHVKMHVLFTYPAVKRRVRMGSRNLVPAVSPMSGSPTFDTGKKRKQKNRARQIYNSSTPYGQAE